MVNKDKGPTYVTKSFLPPREEFDAYVDMIWDSTQLTNNGPLSRQFCEEVSKYLKIDVSRFSFVSNGTLALQLSLRCIVDGRVDDEIITTPFTYVATSSSILWEHYKPVFVDIEQDTLTIDPLKIEAAITAKTKAILAVHVFGNPCDVEAIELLAKKHRLKVIYDAAHAFGVKYKSRSILEYGDISTLSFHATKLMHTIEGGATYSRSRDDASRIELSKRFGHNGDEHIRLGINAKANEFQAAMGIANLKYIDHIISRRRTVSEWYDVGLAGCVKQPKIRVETEYNYAYYPIIMNSEHQLVTILARLEKEDIYPRRYFYPSLNTLAYIASTANCRISEDVASRILCLPLYPDLSKKVVDKVCEIIKNV